MFSPHAHLYLYTACQSLHDIKPRCIPPASLPPWAHVHGKNSPASMAQTERVGHNGEADTTFPTISFWTLSPSHRGAKKKGLMGVGWGFVNQGQQWRSVTSYNVNTVILHMRSQCFNQVLSEDNQMTMLWETIIQICQTMRSLANVSESVTARLDINFIKSTTWTPDSKLKMSKLCGYGRKMTNKIGYRLFYFTNIFVHLFQLICLILYRIYLYISNLDSWSLKYYRLCF